VPIQAAVSGSGRRGEKGVPTMKRLGDACLPSLGPEGDLNVVPFCTKLLYLQGLCSTKDL
jgi:hypothetical protein